MKIYTRTELMEMLKEAHKENLEKDAQIAAFMVKNDSLTKQNSTLTRINNKLEKDLNSTVDSSKESNIKLAKKEEDVLRLEIRVRTLENEIKFKDKQLESYSAMPQFDKVLEMVNKIPTRNDTDNVIKALEATNRDLTLVR